MKKRMKRVISKYIVWFLAFVMMFSVTDHANSNVENNECKPEFLASGVLFGTSNSNMYRFKTHIEEISGLTISYPETMTLFERYSQELPYPEPDRILKRISIVEGQLFLDIDVWLKMEREFADWLGIQDEIFTYTQTNIYGSTPTEIKTQKFAISIQENSYPRMVL